MAIYEVTSLKYHKYISTNTQGHHGQRFITAYYSNAYICVLSTSTDTKTLKSTTELNHVFNVVVLYNQCYMAHLKKLLKLNASVMMQTILYRFM
jgi:hypothetical protein